MVFMLLKLLKHTFELTNWSKHGVETERLETNWSS